MSIYPMMTPTQRHQLDLINEARQLYRKLYAYFLELVQNYRLSYESEYIMKLGRACLTAKKRYERRYMALTLS